MAVDLGVAKRVDAQTFGQPGQRTFRLRILGSASESASLWMEKEHLQTLTLALQRVLSNFGHDKEEQTDDLGEFPETPTHDFQVSRLGMGFKRSTQTVTLRVDEFGKEENSGLRFGLRLGQCVSLVQQIAEITGGGRPPCSLCGQPANQSGHTCIRSNGHFRRSIQDAGPEKE